MKSPTQKPIDNQVGLLACDPKIGARFFRMSMSQTQNNFFFVILWFERRKNKNCNKNIEFHFLFLPFCSLDGICSCFSYEVTFSYLVCNEWIVVSWNFSLIPHLKLGLGKKNGKKKNLLNNLSRHQCHIQYPSIDIVITIFLSNQVGTDSPLFCSFYWQFLALHLQCAVCSVIWVYGVWFDLTQS